MGHWLAWAALWAAPVAAAWLFARLLGFSGAVTALPAPSGGTDPPLEATGWTAMVTTALVAAGVAFVVGRRAPRGPRLATGAAAAAVCVLLGALTLIVWLFEPVRGLAAAARRARLAAGHRHASAARAG